MFKSPQARMAFFEKLKQSPGQKIQPIAPLQMGSQVPAPMAPPSQPQPMVGSSPQNKFGRLMKRITYKGE